MQYSTYNMTALSGACLLLLLVAAEALPHRKSEGDSCWEGGSRGTCRRVRSCEVAQRAIQNNRPLPSRCGFIGYEEVVCCPTESTAGGDDNSIDFGNDITRRRDDTRNDEWDTVRDDGWGSDRGNQRDRWREDRTTSRPTTSGRRSVKACNFYKDFIENGPSYHILDGVRAANEEFPHMAALGFRVAGVDGISWLCGASLISEEYVLTAAHCCTSRMWKQPIRVQLGTLNLTGVTADEYQFGIDEIFVHPEYKKPNYYHDIALIKLDRKVAMSEKMMPACLYTKSGNPAGEFTVTGWGATNAIGTKQSPVLLKTTISAVQMSVCQKYYKSKFPDGLDSSVICAGDPEGRSDTCSGDSGGPLQVKERESLYSIVGVTSLGPNPCGGSIPTLYTRVSSHLDWIEKIVWP